MSIVNFQTGEMVEGETVEPDLTATEARQLTDEIRQTLRVGHGLIVKAFKGRAWIDLGYRTWDGYCAGEFAEARMVRLDREQRQEIVAEMKREGMSNRAIASGIGADYKTVMRDAQLVQDGPVAIRGIDGKDRPNKPPVNASPRPETPEPRASNRRALPDVARDMGIDLRRLTERFERLRADDRFGRNKNEVAAHLRHHLAHALAVLTDLEQEINSHKENSNG